MKDDAPPDITPELLLSAYASGVFPMADSAQSHELYWVDPRMRGVLPLDGFHISRSLRRDILRRPHQVTTNRDFEGVLRNCADREETWINAEIFGLYTALHAKGHAHSLEVWRDDRMIGGVYGVALGGAFFGESMFSKATNGSKIALAYMTHMLRDCGFVLFDTQFVTDHLITLGAIEVTRQTYHQMLGQALAIPADFNAAEVPQPLDVVQWRSQTS